MRHLTIRNVPPALAARLAEAKRASGASLNQTVPDVLSRALCVGSPTRRNGLAELAGTWTDEEVAELESALCFTEELDDELWR